MPQDERLERILEAAQGARSGGKPASYIPALAAADPGLLGLAVAWKDGSLRSAGAARVDFTVQSISKAFALAWVLEERGEDAVFSKVGKEPSGDPFNSIIRLETDRRRRPFNPFINAGALVVTSLLPGATPGNRIEGLLGFMSRMTGRDGLGIDAAVRDSERDSAARNRAIAWFLSELGLLEGDVDETLDLYFRQCAIMLCAEDLARAGLVLALDGMLPDGGGRLLEARNAHIVKSLMSTCGLYDGSGEFSVETGIPAKSGVGGGIMGAVRDRCGIAAFGPALDERGNSSGGIEALRLLSDEYGLRAL